MWNWLNKKVKQADDDWANKEIKKFADDLEAKHKKAIEYLGDKWILKGGQYNRSNVSLGKK